MITMQGIDIDYGKAPRDSHFKPTAMVIWLEKDGVRRKVFWQADYVDGKKPCGSRSRRFVYGSCASIPREKGERIVKLRITRWTE